MAGSVLITGANGTLALPAVDYLLENYPEHTAILTVRDASEADPNTQRLREIISRYPEAKASIQQLDLSSISTVHDFASALSEEIASEKTPPLKTIVCNACYWNLVADPELTDDGYDKTFQINHISHVALVLRLLDSFSPDGGRIVMFSSEAHEPGRALLEKIPPTIPDDLDLLAKPTAREDKMGAGFHRYGCSKLATTAWTHALNRYLEKDENLNKITAVAYNPGGLVDSRMFQKNTSLSLSFLMRYAVQPLLPLLKYQNPQMRLGADSGADAIELALDRVHPGERGYFELLEKDESSPESRDESKQEKLWIKSAQWARISKDNTALKGAFQ
ncbi:NAD(P)-binding protein [Annulohypoxylon maeteangense]|uniref:NAD(P)-binding protein n=1 Tax=Annulohypoxylon maeteangense TaxID=1927788 RepID=UPI002008A3FE|nr:NAD(P)-binding protein [Annulohypoxylon maeteangense]KAI0888123.1 NAD(P)-binding protein [Annulohypoxylon maeteangense]